MSILFPGIKHFDGIQSQLRESKGGRLDHCIDSVSIQGRHSLCSQEMQRSLGLLPAPPPPPFTTTTYLSLFSRHIPSRTPINTLVSSSPNRLLDKLEGTKYEVSVGQGCPAPGAELSH